MENVEQLSAVKRRISFHLPAASLDAEINQRLKRLARTVRISGFRPGKVPLKVIEQRYGPQVRGEAMEEQARSRLAEVLREHALDVVGVLEIAPMETAPQESGGDAADLGFAAVVEVMPEVEPGDVSSLEIQRPVVDISEDDIERTVEILRRQRRKLSAVERPARTGDVVRMDFDGSLDGAPFEGGSARGVSIELGEGRLLKDFEQALEGVAAGESKTFPVTFPADYFKENLAGRQVEFTATVHEVSEVQLPELDTDFARALGIDDGDLDKMRQEVREHLGREVRNRIRTRLRNQVFEGLVKVSDVEVPDSLVHEETRRMMANAEQELQSRGAAQLAGNLKPEQFVPQARQRVLLGLLISALSRREGMSPTDEQLQARARDQAESFEDSEQVYQWLLSDQERRAELQGLVLEDCVVDWVLERARVEDEPMSVQDLLGAAAA